MSAHVRLQSKDGRVFRVGVEVANVSPTLRTMMDNLGTLTEDDILPLIKIDSTILEKVLEWAEHHKDDPPVDDPLALQEQDVQITEWDERFFEVDQTTLFDLFTAADFLGMQGLVNAACKTVANIITGMTPEEIRAIMAIENDFAAEEENR